MGASHVAARGMEGADVLFGILTANLLSCHICNAGRLSVIFRFCSLRIRRHTVWLKTLISVVPGNRYLYHHSVGAAFPARRLGDRDPHRGYPPP